MGWSARGLLVVAIDGIAFLQRGRIQRVAVGDGVNHFESIW